MTVRRGIVIPGGNRLSQRQGMNHTRGALFHPIAQGKLEHYHASLKNLVQVQTYFDPWTPEREVARFVDFHDHQRCHESLSNLTPEDVYSGTAEEVRTRREEVKQQTPQAWLMKYLQTVQL